MSEPSRAKALVGVALAVGIACLPLSRWEDEFGGLANLLLYELTWWLLVAGVLVYVRRVEHRPLASLRFTSPGVGGVLIGIGAGIAMVAALAAIYLALFPALGVDEDADVSLLGMMPLWWRILSVVRAAVGEEVVFRGYAIERLELATGRRWLAALVSWAIFTLAHVGPWGWAHLLVAGTGGAILTALYLWRRNLWVNIIAHAIVDGVAVLL